MSKNITIGLIFLGSGDFYKSKELTSSSAFTSSYLKMKNYFLSNSNYNIDEKNILDLFESDIAPSIIDTKLREFLQKTENQITDLIFYYVGHGCFDRKQGFILATKSIEDDNKAMSGLLFSNLANRMKKDARDLRTYFILDCCFAGEASTEYQSSILPIIEKQFISDFPQRGTTMMCSSSKDLPSIIISERNITMFTEGLERSLTEGSKVIKNKFLTLRELCDTTYKNIKSLNPGGEEVRPEIHTPIQDEGDIADLIRLFPNMATFQEPYDINKRANKIRELIMSNGFINSCNLLMDFVEDFDIHKKHNTEVIILVSECRDLEDERSDLERPDYLEERRAYYKQILDILTEIESQNV
ncbi:hypothetical protein IMCC3317_04820 [Kordia antarctica]|uniref:Peptidase C14 caspase domain-containing protein n=1 Tax=Kordia antarctica TaxID=1218801 RepID=A0A7L4ZG07_9FLAO|nr:caspase family protein [Kordia antarctica]QHI35136.1 hypothetical protein IMCC3317_04820 [Kordia antarctica]